MITESPHRRRPLQPEFNFETVSVSSPAVPPRKDYDEAPPPEALEVPPPPDSIPVAMADEVTLHSESQDYDEAPPPEAVEVPPPPETAELSEEELDSLDKLNVGASPHNNIAQGTTYIVASPNFGEMLQALRLDHRFTIRQLSEKAHLTESAIRDLESGQVSRLNSNANYHYCRSQIERICQVYGEGISPAPILDAFNQELLKYAPPESSGEPLTAETAFQEERSRRFSSLLISMVIILLLLLIVGGWAYKRYEIGRQEKLAADYDLPALIPPPQLPLTPLDIPTH